MNCSKCGFPVGKNDLACKVCGEKLVKKDYDECIKCGYRIKETDEFCKVCGHEVGKPLPKIEEVVLKPKTEVKKDEVTLTTKIEGPKIKKTLTIKDAEKMVTPAKKRVKAVSKKPVMINKDNLKTQILPTIYGVLAIILAYFTKGLILPLAVVGIIESNKSKTKGMGLALSIIGVIVSVAFLIINGLGMVEGFLEVKYQSLDKELSFKAERIWERKKDVEKPEIRLIYDKNKGVLDFVSKNALVSYTSLDLPNARKLLQDDLVKNFPGIESETYGSSSYTLISLGEDDLYYGYLPYRSSIYKGRYYFVIDIKKNMHAMFKSSMPVGLDNKLFDEIELNILKVLKTVKFE